MPTGIGIAPVPVFYVEKVTGSEMTLAQTGKKAYNESNTVEGGEHHDAGLPNAERIFAHACKRIS